MTTLGGQDAVAMLKAASAHVIANEQVLTRADQTIGDGDHGIGMARGFKAAVAALDRLDGSDGPGAAFSAVGRAVMASAGGASGAVFGTFFNAAGKAMTGPDADVASLAAALDEGAKAVMARGKAQAGDKTMLDALLPAIEALSEAETLASGLSDAAAAAREGAEATARMVARTGRAKTLGERSIGHADPGALTTSLLFEGMAEWRRPAD